LYEIVGLKSRTLPAPEADQTNLGCSTTASWRSLHVPLIDPAGSGFDVVIAGHSHRPSMKTLDGLATGFALHLNGGGAG